VSRGVNLLYKPLGLALGVIGGAVAGALFKQAWKRLTGEEGAPEATDPSHGWGEVVLAAAMEGATFAAVKAALERGGAQGVHHLTGSWPGR
jgi:hypothetical protein